MVVEMDRRLRPQRRRSRNMFPTRNSMLERPEGRYILRPSCVAGPCSGTGAVTMKNSDYGAL
jgi:hypothetical protein